MNEQVKLEMFTAELDSELELQYSQEGVRAGFPSPAQDYTTEAIDLNKELVHHPSSTFYARCVGDSMKDSGIDDGDLLIIESGSRFPVDCRAADGPAQIELRNLLGRSKQRTVEKHYRALVEGHMRDAQGRVELPIGRSHADRKKMAVVPVAEGGREALTEWRVLAEGAACTLLDVHLHTGRTHQIRVHMKSLGHPVCGDPLYGSPRGARVERLMLHAWSLAFNHPATGERLSFTAPLPPAFLRSLEKNGIMLDTRGET